MWQVYKVYFVPEITILTPSGSLAKSMVDHKEDINFKITKFIRELENESDASDPVKEKAVQLLCECRQYLQNKWPLQWILVSTLPFKKKLVPEK